jgi:hypothetical protein
MSVRTLSEQVIVQVVEDLFDPATRAEAVDFFRGDGFHFFADVSGMNARDKGKLLVLLERLLSPEEQGPSVDAGEAKERPASGMPSLSLAALERLHVTRP